MTEDHKSRISDLYRQSSQETPPAHLDQAVLDKARKSVRFRALSPFGNHWVAGGAVAGVALIGVLLVLNVPQLDDHAPQEDVPVVLSEPLPVVKEESAQSDAVLSELPALPETPPAETELASRAVPGAAEEVQDTQAGLPEVETTARQEQQPETVPEERVAAAKSVPAESWYLQVGSFREKHHAVELQTRLSKLGFSSVIQEVSMDNMDVYHRVRLGPFTDQEALKQTRRKLDELGIGTLTVKSRQ